MKRRALLIVNPRARHGRDLSNRVERSLRDMSLDVVRENAGEGETVAELLERHRDSITDVVIGGGDGTLNAAAVALVQAALPVGIVPLGTANDLARTLGLPSDPADACRVIGEGNSRRIDLGVVNGKYFFNAASVGLSVAVARRLTGSAKGRWGWLAYLGAAARVFRHARPFRAEIRGGGKVRRARTVQVTVGNGRHYGGGLTVAEDADIDDGRLDLYSLEVDRWWQLLRLLPAFRSGTLSSHASVYASSGTEFEVIPLRSRPVSADGEIITTTPARFSLLRQGLEVYVPPTKPGMG